MTLSFTNLTNSMPPHCEKHDEQMILNFYPFTVKPAAKSSTSVCMATVCPKCGHKFDGKIGGAGEPCSCKCHEGRV
jgi:hypothetical protein